MFHVEDQGSIILIRPLTEDVEKWLKENVAEDAQWFGGALVVEPRYLAPLIEGMFEEGSPFSRAAPRSPTSRGSRSKARERVTPPRHELGR